MSARRKKAQRARPYCPLTGSTCRQNCAFRLRYGCAVVIMARALYRYVRDYEEVQGVGPSSSETGEEEGGE